MAQRNIITLTGELNIGQMSARLKALKSAIEPTRQELGRLNDEKAKIETVNEKDRTKEQVARLSKLKTEIKNVEAVLKDLEAETTNNARAMSALSKVQLKGLASSTGTELQRAIKEMDAKLKNFTGKDNKLTIQVVGVDGVREKITMTREELEKLRREAAAELKVRMGGMGDALKESQALREEMEKLTPIERERIAAKQSAAQSTIRQYNEERNAFVENVEYFRMQENRLFEEKKQHEATIQELRQKGVTTDTTYSEQDISRQSDELTAKIRAREAAERKALEARRNAAEAGVNEQMIENGVVSATERQANIQQTAALIIKQATSATEQQAQAQQHVNEQLQQAVELTKEQKDAMVKTANEKIKQAHGADMSTKNYPGDKEKYFQYELKKAQADVWGDMERLQKYGRKFEDPLGFSLNSLSISELERDIELLKQMGAEEVNVTNEAPKAASMQMKGLHEFVSGLQGEFKTLVETAKETGADVNDFLLGRIGENADDVAKQIWKAMSDGKVLSDPLLKQADESFAKIKDELDKMKTSVMRGEGISLNEIADHIGLTGQSGLRGIVSQATPSEGRQVVEKGEPVKLPYYMKANYERDYRRQLIARLSEEKGIRRSGDPDKAPAAIAKQLDAEMEKFRQMRENPELRKKFIEVYQQAVDAMKKDIETMREAAGDAIQDAQRLGASSSGGYREKLDRSVAPLKGRLGITEDNGGKLPWEDPEVERAIVPALNMRNKAEGLATVTMEQAVNAGKKEAEQIAELTKLNEQEAKSTMTRAEALAELQAEWMKLNGSRQHTITSEESISTEGEEKVHKTISRNVSAKEFFDYRYSGKGASRGESALAEDRKSLKERIDKANKQLPILDALASEPVRNEVKADGELLVSDFNATIVNGLREVSSNKKLTNAAGQIGEKIKSIVSSELFKRGGAESQALFQQITQWITDVRSSIDSVAADTGKNKTEKADALLRMMNASKPVINEIAGKYTDTGLTEEQMKRPAEAAAKLREELAKNEKMLSLVEQTQRSWSNNSVQATQQQTQAVEKQNSVVDYNNQQNELRGEIAGGVVAELTKQEDVERLLADDKRVVSDKTQEEVDAFKREIDAAEDVVRAAKEAEAAERAKLESMQSTIENADKLREAEMGVKDAEEELAEYGQSRKKAEEELLEFEGKKKDAYEEATAYMEKYGKSLVMSEGDIRQRIANLTAQRSEQGVTPTQYKEYEKEISFLKQLLGELQHNINTSMANLKKIDDPNLLKTLKQHFVDIVNDVNASDESIERAKKSLEKLDQREHQLNVQRITDNTSFPTTRIGEIQKRVQEARQLQKNTLTTKKEWVELQEVIDKGTKAIERFNSEQVKAQAGKDQKLLNGSLGRYSEQEIAQATKRLQDYAASAKLSRTERVELNRAIERGNAYLQKTSNEDNLARMTKQYEYLTRTHENLSNVSDDAMRKQQQYWLQQSTLVRKGTADEQEYLERYQKTTSLINERQARQRMAVQNAREEQVSSLASKKVTDLDKDELALTRQVLEHKEYMGRLEEAEVQRLAEIRRMEFERTANVKAATDAMQQTVDRKNAEEAAVKVLLGSDEERASVTRKQLELAKQVYAQIVATGRATDNEKELLRIVLAEEQNRLETARQYSAEATRNANELRAIDVVTKGVNLAERDELELAKKVYEQKVLTGKASDEERGYLVDILKDEERRLRVQKDIANEAHGMDVAHAESVLKNPIAFTAKEVEQAIKFANEYLQVNQQNESTSKGLAAAIEQCKLEQQKFNEEAKVKAMQAQLGDYTRLSELTKSALDTQEKFWEAQKKGANSASEAFRNANANLDKIRKAQAEDAMNRIGVTKESFIGGGIMLHGNGMIDQIQSGTLGSIDAMKKAQEELEKFKNKFADPKDVEMMDLLNNSIERVKLQIEAASKALIPMEEALARVSDGENLYNKEEIKSLVEESDIGQVEKLRESLANAVKQYKALGDEKHAQLAARAVAEIDKAALAAGKTLQTTASGLKQEAEAAFRVSEEMNSIALNPSSTKSIKKLKQAYNELKRQIDEAEDSQAEYNKQAAKLRGLDKEIHKIQEAIHDNQNAFEEFFSDVKSQVVMIFGIRQLAFKIGGLSSQNKELSDSMVNVQKVTGMANVEVEKLSYNLASMDTRHGQLELMKMAEQAGKLGLYTKGGAQAIEEFVRASDMIASTLGEDIGGAEAVSELVKVNDLISRNSGESEGLYNSLNKTGSAILAVGNNSAASYGDVTEFVKATGAVGASAKMNMQQLIALGATFSSLGAKVDQSATSTNKFMVGLQRNYAKVAESLGMSAIQLGDKIDNGDTFGALLDVLDRIKSSGSDSTNQIGKMLDALGGRKNAQMITALTLLSSNVDRVREELGYANEEFEKGTLMADEYYKAQNSLAGITQRISNSIQEAFVNPKAQESMKAMMKVVAGVVSVMLGFVGAITSVPGLLVLTTVALIKATTAFRAFTASQEMSRLGVLKKVLADNIKYIGLYTKSLFATGKAADSAKTEMSRLISEGKAFKGVMALAATGLVAVIGLLYKWGTGVSKAKEAINKADEAINEQTGAVNMYFRELGKLSPEYKKLHDAHEQAKNDLEKVKQETDNGTKSEQDLRDAIEREEKAREEMNKVDTEASKVIGKLNTTYGNTIKLQLTDLENSEKLAIAHRAIAAAIREEANARMENDIKESIYDEYRDDIVTQRNDLSRDISSLVGSGYSNADTGSIMNEIFKAADDKIEEYIANGKTKMTESEENEISNQIVKTLNEKFLSDKGKVRGIDFGKYEFIRGNIEEYIEAKFGEQSELATAMQQVNSRIEDDNAKSAESLKERVEYTSKEINKAIYDAESGSKNIKDLSIEARTQMLSNLEMYISSAQKLVTTAADSERKVLMANLEMYQGYMKQIQKYNYADTRAMFWGENGMDLSKRSAETLAADYEAFQNAAGKVGNGASVEEVFKLFGNDDDYRMDLATKLLKVPVDQRVSFLRDEAKAIKDELDRQGFNKKAKFKWDKGRSRQDHDFEGAIAELDRYYKEQETHFEHQLAMEEISEEEARRRKDDLEKEHLERRAALRWTFSKKSTADERKLFLDWWDERMKVEHNGATLYSVDWKKVDAEIKRWDDKAHKVNLKHRAEDRNRIEELQIEYNKMLKKALMEDRPVEKFAEELRKNLDELALFNTSIPEVANERMLNVLDIVRESYLHGADDIRKSIDEINSSMNWGLSDDQIEVMTARIEAATDQYDDMIRQQAQRIKKRIETSYKLNGADGVSYDDRKNFLMERFSLAGERYGKFDSAGFGGGYLGISSSDRVSWETQKAKVELSKLEMRDLEAQRKKRLALAKDEKERFAINQQFSILEVEKRAEVNELVREQIALQEDMAMKIVEHMNEYEGVARDLMKSYSELGGPIFNSDGTLHGIDAAKMSYNRDNGINQGKSKYIVYKGDGTYETKWMTEEQRLVEERDLAAKNARIEATNKALQEWGEKMAQDITDAFQRQFNEQVVEKDAEMQVERERIQLANDRAKAQIDSEKLYTQAFKSELANRMEAMMDFVDGLQSLYEGSVGKGLFDKEGVADKIATGVQDIADASKAAVEKNIKSGAVVDWNSVGLSESASVSVGRNGLTEWGGSDSVDGSDNFRVVPADPYSAGIVGMPDFSEFAAKEVETYNAMRERMVESTIESNVAMERSQKSTMASMIQSANLYGITYNTVMNDNLSATQKTGMIMLQSVSQMFMSMTSLMGSAMINQLTAKTAETTGEVALDQTAGIARLFKDHNFWVAMGLTAALTGLLGAGMALANRKMQKSKAEIAAATGASQGRLTTGMLTYASGKYNGDKKRKQGRMASGMVTFADGYVSGHSYEVDGADGKQYDAKFVGNVSDMGTGIKRGTHFGIFSEVKPEMVIDGDTTALMHNKYPMLESAIMKLHRTGSLNMSDMIALNYSGISRTIDTLSRSGALGGRMGGFRMPTFAEGRYPDMADVDMGGMTGADGMGQNGNLQMQQLNETLAMLQQTLAGGINATMSTHDASKKLAKQKRWEERNGVRN